jgi:hypothetical protein
VVVFQYGGVHLTAGGGEVGVSAEARLAGRVLFE